MVNKQPSKKAENETERLTRTAKNEWVRLDQMKVSPLAQRELKQYHVNDIIIKFDLGKLGIPTLNKRGGHYYVIDGQHRVEALRGMGWGDQQIECSVCINLTEQQEAEMFLGLNDALTVNGFDRYRVGIQAGREEDCAIEDIVRDRNLHVSMDQTGGSIHAIGTLRRLYKQTGADNLSRTLRIVHTVYGDIGLSAAVIDGIGLLLHRYDDDLEDVRVIEALANVPGGINALLGNAERIKVKQRVSRRLSVAAAAVDIINANKGKKLRNFWKEDSGRPRLVAS